MRPRKSTPVLTVKQRRRQIINLLAGQLARMPKGIDIPMSTPESPPDSGQQITFQKIYQIVPSGLDLTAS